MPQATCFCQHVLHAGHALGHSTGLQQVEQLGPLGGAGTEEPPASWNLVLPVAPVDRPP